MKTAKMMAVVAVLAFGMMFGFGGVAQAGNITVGDSLIPSGLNVGDSFHLVFVTSTKTQVHSLISTDIAYYNAFVQAAADGAVRRRFARLAGRLPAGIHDRLPRQSQSLVLPTDAPGTTVSTDLWL